MHAKANAPVALGWAFPSAMLVALAGCVAAALAWAQFRGFDLLDGAYYLLVYEHPGDDPDTHTRFQLFARPIWRLCGRNIVALRLVCLAAATAACWVFWRALERRMAPSAAMGLLFVPLWLATMAGMTWVPVALTYNSLATMFSLLALASLLALTVGARPGPPRRRLWLDAPLLGALLVGLYLVKPPAAAALAACSYLVLCFHSGLRPWQRRLLRWVAGVAFIAAAGALIALFAHPAFGQGALYHLGGLEISPTWMRGTLERYAREMRAFLPSLGDDLIWTAVPTLIACCAVLYGRPGHGDSRRRLSIPLGLLLAAFSGAVIQRQLWQGSFAMAVSGEAARFYLVLWCSLLPIWIVCRMQKAGQFSETFPQPVFWVIILFALPLISSFGSTNTPYVSALHETVLWAAGLLLLADQIATATSARWFRTAFAALLCLGAAGHIFFGHFLQPYMYQPSLWKQTETFEIGYPPTPLKVDPALASFLNDVRRNLDANGYKPGEDIFGFFNLPGVIYAVGAREPGAPWYFGTWYHQDDTDGGKLRRVPLDRRKKAWIITQADVTQFRAQFLQSGINFPDGYKKIGQTTNPTTGLEIGIWKPLAGR